MSLHRTPNLLAGLLVCLAVAACTNQTTQVLVPGASPQQAAAVPHPARRPPIAKGAESGKKQLFETAAALNPDCSIAGEPFITVVKAPTNGQMTVEKGEAFPTFPKENVRSACNTQKVPATLLYYTSNPGFTGTDTAMIELVTPLGGLIRTSYVITVR